MCACGVCNAPCVVCNTHFGIRNAPCGVRIASFRVCSVPCVVCNAPPIAFLDSFDLLRLSYGVLFPERFCFPPPSYILALARSRSVDDLVQLLIPCVLILSCMHLYVAEARISLVLLLALGLCFADLSGIRRESQPDSSAGPVSFFPPQRGEVLLHGKSGRVVGPPKINLYKARQ